MKIKMRYCCFLVLLLVLFVSCKSQEILEESKIYVKTQKVSSKDLSSMRSFGSYIQEGKKVNLSFRISGPIDKLQLTVGDKVKKGQIVAELDSRDYLLKLKALKVKYQRVSSEFGRIKKLYDRKRIAVNDYEKSLALKDLTKIQLDAAQNSYKDCFLKAPYNGYITDKYKDRGELVAAGHPIICMMSLNDLELVANIPSSLYPLSEEKYKFYAVSDEGEKKVTFPLKLKAFSRKGDLNQLYKVTFLLEDTSRKFAPGMILTLYIEKKDSNTSFYNLPLSSLVKESDSYALFVYKNNLAKKIKVKVNFLENGLVKVIGGLNDGDEVIVAPVSKLKDNQKVFKVDSPSEGNVGGML